MPVVSGSSGSKIMHAAHKTLQSPEGVVVVVSKSCVSHLCWVKKGTWTKGCGSSRSFSAVVGPCGSLPPVLHWDTCLWDWTKMGKRSRGKVLSFFQWVKSFPPHLGFTRGFLHMLTCVGGTGKLLAKGAMPAWAGRITACPNTVPPLWKYGCSSASPRFQHFLVLGLRAPTARCCKELNHPRTSPTKQCILPVKSLAGFGDLRSSLKEAGRAWHPAGHPAAVWRSSTLSVPNHSWAARCPPMQHPQALRRVGRMLFLVSLFGIVFRRGEVVPLLECS